MSLNFITTLIAKASAITLLLLISHGDALTQEVRLKNGSFEDTPRRGVLDEFTGERTTPPKGWFDCGAVQFPMATPPDIHEGSTGFWDNDLRTNDGKTYLALVVREDDSYESISQQLIGTLKAGSCYSFSIFLAKSKTYLSPTRSNNLTKTNFSQPAVLRVYGGNLTCDEGELLAESDPVDHHGWKEYKFTIEPTNDCRIITLAAYYKTPVLFGYNGHICLDNASNFRIVDCDEPEVLLAAVAPKEPKKKVVPAHRRKKKKEVVVFDNGKKEQKVDTIVYSKPKILDLDRKKMTLGTLVNLDKLYFDADSTDIKVESFEVLNEVTEFMKAYPEIAIEVGGHTNNNPPDSYCDSLSTLRAEAVAKYLIGNGVEDERITFKGYGKRRPIATNATPTGRKKNQRVQVMITSLEYKPEDDKE